MKIRTTILRWSLLVVGALFLTTSMIAAEEEYCGEDAFSLHCPADVTVSCNAELWDLSLYGTAEYHDYTGWHSAGYPVEYWNLNSCNTGTITRTWTVEDYNWNLHSCTQTITVSGGYNPFGYSNIHWPNPYVELEGCNPATHPSQMNYGDGWPTYSYSECSSIGISYQDQKFTVSDGCYKIRRKWTVMDWCQYTGYGWGSSGSWTFTQMIVISGSDVPEITCPTKIEASSNNCQSAWVTADPISVWGEECGSDYTVHNNSPYATYAGANLSGSYPIGTTYVKFTVYYGCGKKKQCTTKVIVKDDKGPTVYCLSKISIALMGVDADQDGVPEDGMIEIWAKDLDHGSSASCNHYGQLTYSFSEDLTDQSKTFTCAELGENDVRMYVTDSYGRSEYCVVTVDVQNNGANIPDCVRTVDDGDEDDDENDDDDGGDTTYLYSIAGDLHMMNEKPFVNGVVSLVNMRPIEDIVSTLDTMITVTLDSFINSSGATLWYNKYDTTFTETIDTLTTYIELESYTDENGKYIFFEMADSSDHFEVTPVVFEKKKSDNVGKEDLDFLLEYLVGERSFKSLDQYIAADVDQNRKIDFDDLKILLEYVSEGENEVLDYDWTFVSADLPEENIKEAFEKYETVMTVDIESKDHMDLNFIAIKVGDLTTKEESITSDIPIGDIAAIVEKSGDISSLKTESRSYKEETVIQSLEVHPNPFLETFTIDYSDNASGTITLEIVDVQGQLVNRRDIITSKGENNIEVDMSKYPFTGVYIYRIVDGDKIFSGKLLRIK